MPEISSKPSFLTSEPTKLSNQLRTETYPPRANSTEEEPPLNRPFDPSAYTCSDVLVCRYCEEKAQALWSAHQSVHGKKAFVSIYTEKAAPFQFLKSRKPPLPDRALPSSSTVCAARL
jgi:hypothetical protein